jgi:hypothetical protein
MDEAVLEGLKAGTALARIKATTIDQVDKRKAL